MRKKRILWVNEASWKNTGYSIYGKEILSRLNKIEEFEVAELATYADAKDLEENPREWKCYPNKPNKDSDEYASYISSPSSVFGDWAFNSVCLDFKPDIVMDIRDWWMFEYQQRSPFRDFYHWSIMPTVDAMPQDPQWINTFASADSVMTYSEFGRDTILNQCDSINFIDVASPAASGAFTPALNKAEHKESMGLDSSALIVGTVMRNQRRKLYPDLLKSFRQYLDKTKRSDVFLHCHTYYPDIGWEIPRLLDKFKLNNRVLFTYRCTNCEDISVGFYQDVASYCKKCKNFKRHLVGIENPIDEHGLNKIYNLFDIYVQYANSEGFGMPQLEAAYAGVPVISTNYSAMESVIKNIGAVGIDPLTLSMECETGC
jgi:glycosyltransferase involved in cell wall biosynthesis